MNKTELIAAMAETSGLSKKDCDAALAAFITTVGTALKSGEKVQLIGDPRIQGSRIQGGSGIQGRDPIMIEHSSG